MSTLPLSRLIGVCLLGASLTAPLARAQAPAPGADSVAKNDLSKRYAIDEQDPESSVPTAEQAMRNPLEMGYLLMDLIARAESATKRGDHAAAVRFNRAIVKAMPERSLAHANLCKAYETVGDRQHALSSCKHALGLSGPRAEDYAHYARLVLGQTGELPKAELEDVEAIIVHLQKELAGSAQGKLLPTQLSCEVATRLADTARLELCTKELATLAPDDARTITFQWALALAQHDLADARAVIAHARKAGLPSGAIEGMEARLAIEADKPTGLSAALREFGPFSLLALLAAVGFLISRKKTPVHA